MAGVKIPFNLKLLVILLVLLVMMGIAGFHLIEGWSYFDGFYMVLTTIIRSRMAVGYSTVSSSSRVSDWFFCSSEAPPALC